MKSYEISPKNIEIKFLSSPIMETISSLHIISDPSHHPHCIDWYYDALSKISNNLLDRIKTFGRSYANWHFAMDIVDYIIATLDTTEFIIHDNFDTAVNEIRNMPDSLFAYIFLGETLLGKEIMPENILENETIIDQYESLEVKEYLTLENIRYFLQNMNSVRNEMLDIMIEYYNVFFKEHWEKNATFYKNILKSETKLYNDMATIEYISQLHKDLTIHNDNLIMQKETIFQIKVENIQNLRVICSAYTYPHLMLNIYKDTLSLYKNILIPNFSFTINEIAETVKLLNDPTRLAIIKVLINSSLTPSELSKIFNVSPAAISQHLKMLKSAGIVTSYRDKHNVIYSAEPKKITHTISTLGDFFKIKNE